MKKIATATIATAGVATIAIAGHGHEAHAAEQGYNPNDPTSYSYSYTIDQQGNYHYTWKGNWSPNQVNHSSQSNYSYNNYSYNYNNYNNYNNYSNNTQSYSANTQQTGGLGASYSTSDRNIKVTTTTAPSSQSTGVSISRSSSSGSNLYTAGQCTYYVFDRVGGKIGSTWGNANNWASAAAASGYTVNNSPSAGAILQTSQGAYGHVAYVESVGSDGSVTVSEMNYGHGAGVVTSRTISASQAASYNYIH
ncbi:CHAP domain-containing protein [Staphylococcus haemolyticus]|uniref:CHAP domain-containing protein n=1 Tax=Staphylococcus haemolyticus TaxID=1283 RepID=UPI001F0B52BC|nr:CHAP domain-containing protein [Staphylococcus haemolyticus]MCH4326516.1 CHAP domain-containing protein [Staphylococcus haemolyticus]